MKKTYTKTTDGNILETVTTKRVINIKKELLREIFNLKNLYNQIDKNINATEEMFKTMGLNIDINPYLEQIKQADSINEETVKVIFDELGIK